MKLLEPKRVELLPSMAGPLATDEEALAKAAARAALPKPCMGKATLARQAPTMMVGVGDPIMVGRGDTRRLLVGGAGLRFPRLRPPHRQHPPTGLAPKIHETSNFELNAVAGAAQGGLERFLADIVSGRVTSDPLPFGGNVEATVILGCIDQESRSTFRAARGASTAAGQGPLVGVGDARAGWS